MTTLAPLLRNVYTLRRRFITSALILAAITFSIACGSSASPSSKLSGNTSVTVMLSSTANDQLSEFGLVFQNIVLTSQAGKPVTVFSGTQGSEFMDVNGGANPFVNVTVPQDIYTAATVTLGSAEFTCITLTPSGGLDTSTFAYGQVPVANVTVNVPSPITITGDSMGLSLDLVVSQSATYSSCYDPNGNYTYSITPAFNLTPITFSSQSTNPNNGKVAGLDGEITAIGTGGNHFTLTRPLGSLTCPCPGLYTLPVTADNDTVYQGVGSFSAIAVGTFVDMDGAIQSDGSLLATRIAVEDTNATNQSVLTGPVLQAISYGPTVIALGREQEGYFSTNRLAAIWMPYDFGSSAFQVSGQLTNLQNLPFVASFNAENMVAGQNVYVTTESTVVPDYPYIPATTITLMPQTINGQVTSASAIGGFSVYTISLASYDLFPTLAAQPYQTAVLTNPSQVDVYVDNNTQMLNTQPLAAGSTLRFYGLVFNDNGTLRMDCAQVNDGVAFTTPPSASPQAHMVKGVVQQIRSEGPSSIRQTVSVTR
jgi:uncharacterized protein DUF5666